MNNLHKIAKKLLEECPAVGYNISMLAWDVDILKKKCPICGMELIEKGDWIFCPKNSIEIPDCDSPYHIAKNTKTGQGWSELI